MGDDWRVRIALDQDDLPEPPEPAEQALVAALRSHLGDQVAVTSNGTEIFLYTSAARSADEAAQVARQVLARHDVSVSVRTEFWSSLKEEWRDVTDEPSADPVAERRAAGREVSRKAGFPAWQVRVEMRSHRDVVALAGYLAARDGGYAGAAGTCSSGRTAKTTLRAWSGSSPATAALMRRLPSGSGGSAIATCCSTPPAPRSSAAGTASARLGLHGRDMRHQPPMGCRQCAVAARPDGDFKLHAGLLSSPVR